MHDQSQAYLLSGDDRAQLQREVQGLLKRQVALQQALREQQSQAESDLEALMLELLEVLDAMDYIAEYLEQHPEPEPAFIKRLPRSLSAIRRKLGGVLEKRQVENVELPDGQPDFELCRVVDKEVRPDLMPQTITKVVRRGYRLGEKVLRPVEVIVATPE